MHIVQVLSNTSTPTCIFTGNNYSTVKRQPNHTGKSLAKAWSLAYLNLAHHLFQTRTDRIIFFFVIFFLI